MMENFQPIRIVANRNKFLFAERFLQKNKKNERLHEKIS